MWDDTSLYTIIPTLYYLIFWDILFQYCTGSKDRS